MAIAFFKMRFSSSNNMLVVTGNEQSKDRNIIDLIDYIEYNNFAVIENLLKDYIIELYEIPLLRFRTDGSGEKEKIIEMLDKLVG